MLCSTSLQGCSSPPRPRLALMPHRARRVRRQPECHLYFARQVSFLSCADTPCRRPIKMSPLCQLEMTLPWGSLGGVWGDGSANERWRAYAARVAAGFGPTTADG